MNHSFWHLLFRTYYKTVVHFINTLMHNFFYMSLVSLRLPFNTKCWPGYIFAFLLEASGAYAVVLAPNNYLCVFIGSCWILTSLAEDITHDLNELNMDKSGNRAEIQWRFCSISKRLSEMKEFSKILSYQQTKKSPPLLNFCRNWIIAERFFCVKAYIINDRWYL